MEQEKNLPLLPSWISGTPHKNLSEEEAGELKGEQDLEGQKKYQSTERSILTFVKADTVVLIRRK